MAKFIKFDIVKSITTQPVGNPRTVLVDVDNIAEIEALGVGAVGNAKTLVVNFIQGPTGAVKVTFKVHVDIAGSTNPTLSNNKPNPIYDAAIKALTANPGGVAATVSLGKDQAATPKQMYFTEATYS